MPDVLSYYGLAQYLRIARSEIGNPNHPIEALVAA